METETIGKKPVIVDVVDPKIDWVKRQMKHQQLEFLQQLDLKFPRYPPPDGVVDRILEGILILCISNPGALPGLRTPPTVKRLRDGGVVVSWDLHLVPFVRNAMVFSGKKKKIVDWVTFRSSPGDDLVTMSQRYGQAQRMTQMDFFFEALPTALEGLERGQDLGEQKEQKRSGDRLPS